MEEGMMDGWMVLVVLMVLGMVAVAGCINLGGNEEVNLVYTGRIVGVYLRENGTTQIELNSPLKTGNYSFFVDDVNGFNMRSYHGMNVVISCYKKDNHVKIIKVEEEK